MEFELPNVPSRCTWTPNAVNSPHVKYTEKANDRTKVLPDILHAIGRTPIVRLNKLPTAFGIKCEILVKCEFMNPAGSVKDRVAYKMVRDAEATGRIKPGYTLIEVSSGNTGIGLATVAAVRGYKCIIVMPAKISKEKEYILRALGADVVRTPKDAAWNSPEGIIATSQRLQRQIPNSVILDQFTNPGNPLAHYDHTATEIWEQCEGKVDVIVCGTGTCGTISGIGRKIKELSPSTQIVAADPEGSILAHPPELNKCAGQFFDVEGIGYYFLPTVMDRKVVDKWIKTNDKETFTLARKLIKEEGLLCGGSSGAALAAAIQVAKDLPADKRVVILLADGIHNYLTKFASDLWMEARNFIEPPTPEKINEWWWNLPAFQIPLNKPVILPNRSSCDEALKVLKQGGFHHEIPVADCGNIKGFITLEKLQSSLLSGKVKRTDSVGKAMIDQFYTVDKKTSLGRLSRMLQNDVHSAVLIDENTSAFIGILTQTDLFNFVYDANNAQNLEK